MQTNAGQPTPLVRWFRDLRIEDVPLVGGKNASLGEMFQELTPRGIQIPNGFAVTAEAYREFLASAGLGPRIEELLRGIVAGDLESLSSAGNQIRQAILSASLPPRLLQELETAYLTLQGSDSHPPDVAVRSSATAEDLPDASFAGQQETFLHIRGQTALADAVRRCFASLFNDRAISYRNDKGYGHTKVALSVGVQRMVRSDLACSGVMFTLDTESGFTDAVLINASYGLGEFVVQGAVTPDEFYVFKPTLRAGFAPILQKRRGAKEVQLICDDTAGQKVCSVPVKREDQLRFSIGDEDILQLARWACVIEDHYSAKRGSACPMDIEWAKDGLTGDLFIVQARPETVQSQKRRNVMETYRLREQGSVLATGSSVGSKIASGAVRVINDPSEIAQFQEGEVLVTDKTDPDWEPIMKKARAIVTNRGGRTCHAAIVSRELGLPALVGCGQATDVLHSGKLVTVSCAEGETGFVYRGALRFDIETTSLELATRPRTKVMMNVGNPAEAFTLSAIPNDGVGLAREEFIVSSQIKVHPLALLHFDQLHDLNVVEEIQFLTAGYDHREDYYVDQLAQGVAMIAAAFHPKDVILRLSDFKSNEYANLLGGRQFEPIEENPMIGFRGASRYYHPKYQAAFGLECRAMLKVREEMGLTNLKLMIPFCRTVEEGRRVLAEMEHHGLVRGLNGLEVFMMCELPSNVILAEQFADIFDGFSIGSNDLTQLILGVDRDSALVAPIFDERNEAVKSMIADVIRVCRARGRKIGICGQAPSDYPEFAEFLVEQGIDSISLNPDTVVKTTAVIAQREAGRSALAPDPAGRRTMMPRDPQIRDCALA